MYVVTLDQRPGAPGDPVPSLLRLLADLDAVVPFQRARPDALQGIVAEPHAAVAAALAGLRGGAWSVGIGVGAVRLETATDGQGRPGLRADGPGTVHARRAAEAARSGGRVPVGVAADDGPAAAHAQAVLRLLGRIVVSRTAAEWRVLDLLVPGARGQQKVVAAELGITPQAVSKAVARSLWQEEWDVRPAAARLLELCEQAGGDEDAADGDRAGAGAQSSERRTSATPSS
ncbi:transcriptional regulator [Kocuria dechangensis]|uniref:Transcriptional regulator n=1 Tax=Kocuria dechangensis TaxID=1176249 RepID=A0A917LWX5_9MICC|nr:hypothetical protein [Kocuria dechangensis]GGG60732.1 transcriptional regulator [Kocuria dechangensis]